MTLTEPAAPAGAAGTAAEFMVLTPAEMCEVARRNPARDTPLGERLRLFLMLGRPRTCVPAWLSYWLGTAYADRGLGAGTLLLGAVLALLTSFAANLHNAYTDLAEDSRNLPGRVYLVARYGYRRLRTTLVVLDAAMLAAAALLGPAFLMWFAVAVLALHQYSFRPLRLKARPFGGLVLFAGVLPVPFLCAWVIDRPRLVVPWVSEPFLAVLVFLFLWFLAKGLFKNVPDYHGDRAAGVRTSATVFATWRAASLTASAVTLGTFTLPAVLVAADYAHPRVLLSLLFWPVAAVQCARLVRAADGAQANQVLRADMVLSIAFLTAILVLQAPTGLTVVAVAVAALILVGSDALGIDSRRRQDSGAAAPARAVHRPRTPQHLFDRVAPYYDRMNSALSLGADRWWRRVATAALDPPAGARVLDVATGTGAMAFAVLRRYPRVRLVVGCDLNVSMLRVATARAERDAVRSRTRFVRATAERLPLPDGSFDAATLAFAVDDFADPARAIAELRRVLRPGARLVLLELSMPGHPVPRRLYRAALRLLTVVGRAPGCAGYRHLRDEIVGYRGADAVADLLRRTGFGDPRRQSLAFGLATLHVAEVTGPAPAGE
ncbi:MAG TPA: ubiquinone/menaquinone biosynthesis methyltransferase [Pilimelia sp.]|nr:ubiquinone/menaquinone biosynthesis methyltransferase [Pilimelia sp.]